MTNESFEFRRARGIVWVCDIVGSTRYLNDNRTADAIEAFLPRLRWLAQVMVSLSSGVFVKWTGDGFLAWYEIPLHRRLPQRIVSVLNAVWYMTAFVNVTQLSVSCDPKFRISHGVTYEQDGLMTMISDPLRYLDPMDLIGRSVVLAFRLSGTHQRSFPGIATQRELVEALRMAGETGFHFSAWRPSKEERLKFFKGERWGTSGLYKSSAGGKRRRTMDSVIRQARRALTNYEKGGADGRTDFGDRFLQEFVDAPPWAKTALARFNIWAEEELVGSLRTIVERFEKLPQKDGD